MKDLTFDGTIAVFGKQRQLQRTMKSAVASAAARGVEVTYLRFSHGVTSHSALVKRIEENFEKLNTALRSCGNTAVIADGLGSALLNNHWLDEGDLETLENIIEVLWQQSARSFVLVLEDEKAESAAQIRKSLNLALPAGFVSGTVKGKKIATDTGTLKVVSRGKALAKH